jgi:hypothetical protein
VFVEPSKTSSSNMFFSIVVTYSQFDSNIRVLYVFLGFLKNTWSSLSLGLGTT